MKKEFDNYIFDLYGTLVDIRTDEEPRRLWEKMAQYLDEKFGQKAYDGQSLRKRYLELCAEEEDKLQKENGADYPEIKIEKVWDRLIGDVPGNPGEDSVEMKELCIFFRDSSRLYLKRFDGVLDTFAQLRAQNKKIFLLSNAQRSFTEKELEMTGLIDKFDDIFISSDKGIKKPQKEFMEQLILKHNLEFDKCVMIGNDLFSDSGVAFKNGVSSIFLNTNGYSQSKINTDLRELGFKGSSLAPVIINDGDISKILTV